MVDIQQTEHYAKWFLALKDRGARSRILTRIDRLRLGHTGDSKSVGDKVSELRIDDGPGYRIYYTWREKELILLLAGGDKKSQSRDIAKAKLLLGKL